MKLYHYTSILHLPHILSDGYLRPTESNVDMWHQHAGPDVVWCLDRPEPGKGMDNGLLTNASQKMLPADETPEGFKRRIRFTLEVPDRLAIRWRDWFWTAEMDPQWRAIMVKAGGGEEMAGHWYVVPGRVRFHCWREILDTRTGQPIGPSHA